MDLISQLLTAAISAGTPLLFATLGGILIERSGIIQLGAEGIMLMGAVTAAGTFLTSGNIALTLLMVCVVGGLLGVIHAFLTVTLRANQIVSGLAMTLFGGGLSAYLGREISGMPLPGKLPNVDLSFLNQIPIINVIAHLDILTWLSVILVIALSIYIYRTSWGLHLRAIGDNPATADVMGIRVQPFRYGCVVVGSILIALGGADLLLTSAPAWTEGVTAGRGWIAVALIIFARWNPATALLCAYFFGVLQTVGFKIQVEGVKIPTEFLKMIPYVLTILVLMFVGWRSRNKPAGTPQSLGVPYIREQRF